MGPLILVAGISCLEDGERRANTNYFGRNPMALSGYYQLKVNVDMR